MKIGITTFHKAHNFGAQMQMYALYNFLRDKGHEVWILDYYCPPVEDIYCKKLRGFRAYFNRYIFSGILLLIKDVIGNLHYQKIKTRAYNDFLKNNFMLTARFKDPENMPIDFDYLITGSDQVWGYHITKGRRETYFLDNKQNKDVYPNRISYAASSELISYAQLEADAEYIGKTLTQFKGVSVREESLAKLIYRISRITAETVLDPTFLLSKEEYLKIAVNPNRKNYLCVYQVSASKNLKKIANFISKERNLDIIYVEASQVANSKSQSYGPKEVLGLLMYADVIVTSSFHGTAFSIINRKDFYSVFDSNSLRVQNLLRKFQLESRLILNIEDYSAFDAVAYDENLINDEINKSIRFLAQNII